LDKVLVGVCRTAGPSLSGAALIQHRSMMSCLTLAAIAATSFRIGGIHGVISRGGPLIACTALENNGNIENELRAARAAAADAANAEARLRNMISSADKNAGRAMAAKEAAEERAEDLEAELVACRQLFAEEISFLENELDGLRVSVKEPVTNIGTDESVVELQRKVAKLEQECAMLRGDLDDTREESEALRTLAAQEEQALLATMGELTEKLRQAEKRAASNAAGTGQAGQSERMAELEEQVEALLVQLAQQETAATELMVLRPKFANLELQLKELKSGREQR